MLLARQPETRCTLLRAAVSWERIARGMAQNAECRIRDDMSDISVCPLTGEQTECWREVATYRDGWPRARMAAAVAQDP